MLVLHLTSHQELHGIQGGNDGVLGGLAMEGRGKQTVDGALGQLGKPEIVVEARVHGLKQAALPLGAQIRKDPAS